MKATLKTVISNGTDYFNNLRYNNKSIKSVIMGSNKTVVVEYDDTSIDEFVSIYNEVTFDSCNGKITAEIII